MKLRPQQTMQRMLAISLVGLIVGLITSFATIGFVELVHFLNDILYVSPSSRAHMEGSHLRLITIAVLTIGGLVVGLTLHYGVTENDSIGPPDTIYAVQLHERLPPPVAGVTTTIAAMLIPGVVALRLGSMDHWYTSARWLGRSATVCRSACVMCATSLLPAALPRQFQQRSTPRSRP